MAKYSQLITSNQGLIQTGLNVLNSAGQFPSFFQTENNYPSFNGAAPPTFQQFVQNIPTGQVLDVSNVQPGGVGTRYIYPPP